MHMHCRALTLRVFSNWELILVIMPRAATNDSRDSTCDWAHQFQAVGMPVPGENPSARQCGARSPSTCHANGIQVQNLRETAWRLCGPLI